MSKYTTGEIAKLCGVTVRTVQYYDSRNILVPSELSEGGRRLYSEEDLKWLKIICFLRELDLPINTIAQLLEEEHPENVIGLLLRQQEEMLRDEIRQRQGKLGKLEELRRGLKNVSQPCVESIGDIAHAMTSKQALRRIRGIILGVGLPINALELGAVLLWILKGIWWPFVAVLPVMATVAAWISRYYYRNTAYICPRCHRVFRPLFRESFFASHTPNTRKLACPACGHKGFCVEVYGGKDA